MLENNQRQLLRKVREQEEELARKREEMENLKLK